MAIFVVDALLQPISDAAPCGEDLSFSSEMDAISEARRFEDRSLDQGEWVRPIKEADWQFVAERCVALTTTKSKDLRLAVWFAEASAYRESFRGLGNGYRLLAGLCETFWDGLYPLPESDEYESRIGNLSWLLAKSVRMIQLMPLTEGRDTAYSTADFESARIRDGQADKLAAAGLPSEPGPKLADLDAARRNSSPEFHKVLLVDSRYCLESLVQLEAVVDAHLKSDGPGFSAARDALDGAVRTIARYAGEEDFGSVVGEAGSPAPALTDIGGPAYDQFSQPAESFRRTSSGPLSTRADALKQLQQVAKFFKDTEPHSPVAYLADKAAAWADMPLHSWLRAVIKDPASLAHIEDLLGVPEKKSSTEP